MDQVNNITQILSGELFKALGFATNGWVSNTLSPFVQRPIQKFSNICVGFDQQVREHGFQQASHWILQNFIKDMVVHLLPDIPKEGPLLIASNHPGAYDTLVITSNIPRDDIKIIVNIPLDFINELPVTQGHFIYAPLDNVARMQATRAAISHLKNGGALLIFASGGRDADPALMPGAEKVLNRWSRSLELFSRRVPGTQVLISMVSGVLSPKYVRHPLTIFRKNQVDKQRISEFLQTINQMLNPGKLLQTPEISFSLPFSGGEEQISRKIGPSFMEALSFQAKKLLEEHLIATTK